MRGVHFNLHTKWGIVSLMLDWKLSREDCTFPCWGPFHAEWFSNK